jgi:uncharacterized membrane protein
LDSSPYNEWRLVSLSPFPAWALGLLALAALAGVALATLSLRREPRPGRRALLLALRLAAAGALVLLLLEPGRRLMQTTRVKNRLVVLLDRSASMGFPAAPGGQSREEVAKALLRGASGALSELAGRFTVELYAFDKDVQAVDPARLPEVSPAGAATDLAGAIRQAAAGGGAAAGRKLSGVVVLSDGADNAELGGGLTPKVKSMLQELKAPVSTIAVGAGGLKDLAVERVAVDDFAFVRNTVEITATFGVHGFGPVEIPVVLKREGRIVVSRVLKATGDGSFPVSFSFAPDQTGQFVYTVEAPVYADEAVPTNNSRSFALKVIRDRVRVLMVVGRPSWDVRFLRGLLKQDPNVDLISFFILRTAGDDARVYSDGELSLIPFPVRDIFHDQLKTFDLVILQNFAWNDRSYSEMPRYVRGMRDYVSEGGALVMIGGENSFGEGHYERTDLQDALPVEPAGRPPSTEPFRARLTEEGRRHPVAAAAPSADASAKAWADMPELDGLHVTRAKAGTRVLLDHPFLTVDGANAPVVALGEYGRGRVMAILADSTWLWSFGAAASGGASRVYDRFWNNGIRWLVRDPDLTQVKVAAEKAAVEPGEPVAAVVSARLPDYQPAAGAQIELDLVQADQNRVVAQGRSAAGSDGTARLELMPPQPGPYKLVARASREGASLGQGEDAVAVRAAGPELSDAAVRPELLRAIAEASGGTYLEGPRSWPEIPLVDPETVEVGRRKDLPIWDRWYFLAALAAAVASEWMLRRRWGYA